MITRRDFFLQTGGSLVASTSFPFAALAPIHVNDRTYDDIRFEIPRVRFQLRVLEKEYLPFLLAPRRLDAKNGQPAIVDYPTKAGSSRLEQWQGAVRNLASALPRMNRSVPEATEEIDRFRTFHTATARWQGLLAPLEGPGFELDKDPLRTIRWQIFDLGWMIDTQRHRRELLAWFWGQDYAPLYNELLWDLAPDKEKFLLTASDRSVEEEIRRNLWDIKRKILACEFEYFLLANWVYCFWFPLLSEFDYEFAADALDTQRLWRTARPSSDLTTIYLFFAGDVSAGITNMMTVMANNHFLAIRRLFRKPEVYGSWNCFMPDVITAVMYHKVMILRELALA